MYVKGKGIVTAEPSVVAVQRSSRGIKRVLAVKQRGQEMLGRTAGSVEAIRPINEGTASLRTSK